MVEDARGQPPSMPFWLGESLGRTDELLEDGTDACERWLCDALDLPRPAAQQLTLYLGASKAALGVLPTEDRIVFERFFDEVGDTHLVIHSPYGSRINKAWGLALRKRMCRKFNFELQASALEDSIVLSLGPTHSFALDEVRHYLKPATARDLLVQALLDAPMFGTRWRWNATASLAVRRMNGGRKVPPQFQRSDAQDLLTVVFPDQQACAENVVAEREIPDHPLVEQTLRDCLHETMDVDGFVRLLERIHSGEVEIVTRDLASPSPLSHAILNARPYAFLDDGAAEERRTKVVATKALMDLQTARDIGRLDAQAIAQVRADAWPEIGSADELHDAMCVHGFLAAGEIELPDFVTALAQQRRATRLSVADGRDVLVAAERLHELLSIFSGATMSPPITAVCPVSHDRDAALREIMRGRLDLLGPMTATALAAPLGLAANDVMPALLQLEADGSAMRGGFTAPGADEWCDRRLLARMHRATRDKLRADIQPVPPAQFMRFLFQWHQLPSADSDERREGEVGLADVLRQLEGHAAPASAWEEDLLAARVQDYEPAMLDKLCAVGRVVWWRPAEGGDAHKTGPIRGTPIVLCERDALPHWQQAGGAMNSAEDPPLSSKARTVLRALREHGASFFGDLQRDAGLLGEPTEQALAELVAQGLVTCDTFAGLRALVMPADKRNKIRRRGRRDPIDDAGRWALARGSRTAIDGAGALAEPHVDHIARVLLRRYGVVFRKLLEREEGLPPWRDLHYVY
ncbi:MAG TPA: ATP-dependent DNA helicase, partial [Burkholderiaceae bacterium]|nr:ATP-dependent DNA helicase [Burkholderiaceae bacterium]